MSRVLYCLALTAGLAAAQHKVEPAGPPPSDLAPAIRDALQKDGAKVVAPNGTVFAEVWFRAQAPAGKNSEQGATLTGMPHGALLGAIRFPAQGADRRGQPIKAGVYTMRLSFYPVDGAHQGVAPQRDFALLVPAADDKDLNAAPNYDQLVEMSRKASGTQHPAVFSIWKAEKADGMALKQEEGDWVLFSTIGDVPVGMIVIGTHVG